MPRPKHKTAFSIELPAEEGAFLEQVAAALCTSKVSVIKLAITRLRNSNVLEDVQKLANPQPEGAGRETAQAA